MSQANTVNVKVLKFSELETSRKGQVWVMNNSKGTERRRLEMTIHKLHGDGMDTVVIPKTFIPIELTAQVSKTQLLQSSDFRRAVTRGLLTLIDTASAEELLSKKSARLEQQRLMEEAEKFREAQRNLTNMAVMADGENTVTTDGKEDSSNLVSGVTPAVIQVMSDAKGRQEIEVKNSLQSIGDLTQKDYEYVVSSSTENGQGKLSKWAGKRLSRIIEAANSESEDDVDLEND